MTAVEELRARVRRDLLKAKAFGTGCGGVLCSDVEALLDALEAALSERDDWRANATEFKEPCSEWEARATALEQVLADLLDIRPGVTEPLVAKAAWMRAVALSAKGGET
jgi:hypothetical protein